MKTIHAILAMLVISIATISSVSAFNGNGFMNEDTQNALESGDYEAFVSATQEQVRNRFTEERFNEMAERYRSQEEIRNAIENGDYNAWVAAVEASQPPKITDVVTEDNFDTFVQMHNARMEGDFETAQTLAEELGLEKGQGRPFGMYGGRGKMTGMRGGDCMGG